jgi:threonine/homoserine/homoserine lactone efflux protein
MTLASSLTLFAVMCSLAALPSSSVALVVARSAMTGVPGGLAAAVGIVAGDLIFMSMAILSMAALASQLGALFVVIRYLAAIYLVWFGIQLIRGHATNEPAGRTTRPVTAKTSLATSFIAGLLLTLGDIKAIFFYASLLPTLIDLATLTAADIAIVSAVTITSVGLVKAIYVFAANRIVAASRGFAYQRQVKLVTGGFFISAGGYLILKP